MLIFNDWQIKNDGTLIARQYDNLSRRLLVTGDLPEGWIWASRSSLTRSRPAGSGTSSPSPPSRRAAWGWP